MHRSSMALAAVSSLAAAIPALLAEKGYVAVRART